MMRRGVLLVLLAVVMCSLGASAQRVTMLTNQLAKSADNGASINISQDEGVSGAVSYMENRNGTPAKVSGYSFVIFHASGQFANESASSALNTFRKIYKSVESNIEVDSPTFKVIVGKCFSLEEAAILFNRIEDMYPDAVRTEVSVPLRILLRNQGQNNMTIERRGEVAGDVELNAVSPSEQEVEEQEVEVIETPEDLVSGEATIKTESIDSQDVNTEEYKLIEAPIEVNSEE